VTVKEEGSHFIIIHGGRIIEAVFSSEDTAWRWADVHIDDQVFDAPNHFSKPLRYRDDAAPEGTKPS
jgi:hypothetical protein